MDRAKDPCEDPFIILYNFRRPGTPANPPKIHKRHHKDYSTLPHSIIMTRKMQAELEHK
jgi:hypothetical protein